MPSYIHDCQALFSSTSAGMTSFCCQRICIVTCHRAYAWFMALLLAMLHNLYARTSGASCKCRAFVNV